MPPFVAVLSELSKVTALQSVLPCVATLSAQLTALNETVVRLPSALDPVTGLFDSFNGTITAAVAVVANATTLIATANATLASVNVSGYLAQLDAMNATLATQKAALDPERFKVRRRGGGGAQLQR
jgi:tetrahydromethanopterin S-methyltransferase subunit B